MIDPYYDARKTRRPMTERELDIMAQGWFAHQAGLDMSDDPYRRFRGGGWKISHPWGFLRMLWVNGWLYRNSGFACKDMIKACGALLLCFLCCFESHAVLPIQCTYTSGQTLVGIVRKIAAGVEGDYWDDTNQVFTPTPAGTDHHITLTETTGRYLGVSSAALSTYTGQVSIGILDTGASVYIGSTIARIESGAEFEAEEWLSGGTLRTLLDTPVPPPATSQFENLSVFYQSEKNDASTILVRVADTDGTPSSGAVSATEIAIPAASPTWSAATNAATYTGVAGLYQVALTAAETNVDQRLVRVTAGAGNLGYTLLLNEYRDLETDWQTGGELRNILTSITANAVSSIIVSPLRTWTIGRDAATASNIITLTTSDSVTLAMNFGPALNVDTSLNAAVSATDVSGNGLVPTNVVVSQDKMHMHCDVTGLAAATTYVIRFSATTSDGQTLSVDGTLRTK